MDANLGLDESLKQFPGEMFLAITRAMNIVPALAPPEVLLSAPCRPSDCIARARAIRADLVYRFINGMFPQTEAEQREMISGLYEILQDAATRKLESAPDLPAQACRLARFSGLFSRKEIRALIETARET